jgi:hypothetical protein
MLVRRVNLCGLLFCLLVCLLGCLQPASSQDGPAKSEGRPHGVSGGAEMSAEYKCKQAKDEDRPPGKFVFAGEGTVGAIYGTILSKDERADTWEPVRDVVVELYNYSGGANQEDISRAVREQKRVAACLTGDDGKFSLSGLKPGRYLFHVGARASDKYDEVHAILTLDPSRPPSELKILL